MQPRKRVHIKSIEEKNWKNNGTQATKVNYMAQIRINQIRLEYFRKNLDKKGT